MAQTQENQEVQEPKKSRKIGDVFSDYKTNSNIADAIITKMNLIKKINTLELGMASDEYIEIKEIWYLEKFLRERFQFGQVHMIITYAEGTYIKRVDDEWENLICYMAHKYPLMRPLLLLKSKVELTEKDVNVYMQIKGADFLKARKLDRELENVIHNLFGKKYIVNIEEKVTEQEIKAFQEKTKEIEEQAVHEAMRGMEIRTHQEGQHNNASELQGMPSISTMSESTTGEMPPIPEGPYNDVDYAMPSVDENGYVLEMEELPQAEDIIFGKASRAKEKKLKIKEIDANSGRITLEGRIVNSECRETKTGKGMLIFEIYDGTGVITCKSFAEDATKGNEILEKMKSAKAIKTTGKAGLDAYAGDITVMANIIAEISDEGLPPIPEEDDSSPLILGSAPVIKEPLVKIADLNPESGSVCIDGEIQAMEDKETKSGKVILSIDIYDGTSTMTCKAFLPGNSAKKIIKRLGSTPAIKLAGKAQMDTFSNELTVMANTIMVSEPKPKTVRMDNAEVKRVELHMHTKMSAMDAMTSATDLIKRAMKWGMKSIAITDHGVVQSFPEAHKLLGVDNPDMKVIYGVEAYLAPDNTKSVYNNKGQEIDTTYCVLDLETTGFSAKTEKITEIGIMKVKNGEVIDEFSCFVNPEKHIPQRVSEVTNITDDMVKDAKTIKDVFPDVLEFLGDPNNTVIVAHNANFDVGFLKQNAINLGYKFDYTYLDTLSLAKDLFPNYKKYKLGKIAQLDSKIDAALMYYDRCYLGFANCYKWTGKALLSAAQLLSAQNNKDKAKEICDEFLGNKLNEASPDFSEIKQYRLTL